MRYFNGFALKAEEQFFTEQIINSDYCVAGFSYGAQQAFEYAYNSNQRIDRLVLLSPAFFQNHKPSFIRTQLRYYKADQEAYTQQFLKNTTHPSTLSLDNYLARGTYEKLEELLNYVWEKEKIAELIARGVTLEVFMGEEDKIVDAGKSFEFFSEIATVYWIKGVGHLLR
jgi:pimeloyl-ACP methyl ester carboxylesterase